MAHDYWSKLRGTPAPRPQAQPAQWSPAPRSAPPQHSGLAVPAHAASPSDNQAQQFAEQGYNDKHRPKWTEAQPSDYCPQCSGARYVISQNVGFCWDCGYNNRRTLSDAQIGNFSSPNGGGPSTPTRQIPQGMKNFGTVTGL